jgi:hypothetical protein
MKWQTSTTYEPKDGDKRVSRSFAWFPIACPKSGYTHWLWFVEVEETFQVGKCEGMWHGWLVSEVRS